MSNVPKFVLKRLQENAALETHPDADLLTGFVEKSLLEPERNRVTEHLARCSACRAVVALAMPESPELEVPALTTSSDARRRDWFNPAVLRWVVATAGIVAVTSVGILQYRSHQNKIADDNILLSRNAAPPPVPPADQAPLVPSQPLPVPPQAKQRQPTDSREKAQLSRPEHMITGGSTGSSIKMLRTPPGGYTAASAPGAAVASGYAGGRVSAAPPPPAPNPSFGQQPEASSSSPMVEVESQSTTIATGTENQVADQLAKDEKKQTSKTQSSTDSAVITPPSRWSISADGALQRSWDDGHTWIIVNPGASVRGSTAALSANKGATKGSANAATGRPGSNSVFRAAAAFGSEVWAGGSAAALYHSSDSGLHWTRVVPSASGANLTGDITTIEFSDPQHGTVTTSAGEVWLTADAGSTWARK
jgi:Photosynthesis system II assembly factor YCF48